jgi:hypothetical protein
MTIQTVRAALEGRLQAWASSQNPAVKIAFEEVSFDRPADLSPYVECFLIPNLTKNRDVEAATKTDYGLFQVNVWTQNGTGMGLAQTLAQGIVDTFPILPKVGSVSIEATPSIGRSIKDNAGWLGLPVLIKYRCEY